MARGEPTFGVSDVEYNLVTTLSNLLQGELVMANYEEDARDAGDDATARLFREMREQNRSFAVRCRKELLRLISAGQ